MKRKSLALILLALLMISGFSLNLPFVHAAEENYYTLNVDGYQDDVSGMDFAGTFQEVGDSPYLANYEVSPSVDYVWNHPTTGLGSFKADFETVALSGAAIVSIDLIVHLKKDTGYQFKIYIYDGSSYTLLETVSGANTASGVWLNKTYDVSSYLNTQGKIDGAALGVAHDTTGGAGIYMDYAELSIESSFPVVAVDSEPDSSGTGWVFTEWRYYTFTVTVPSAYHTEPLDFVFLRFSIPTYNGSVLCAFWFSSDGWDSLFTPETADRNLNPVRVKSGSNSSMIGDVTITFPLWFTQKCLDAYLETDAVDVEIAWNETDGTSSSGWYSYDSKFRIYNLGGFSTDAEFTGNAGVLPGGRDFSMFAYNDSYAYKDMIWRNLQHIKVLPTVNFRCGLQTFYYWFGVDYMLMDGNWVTGLNLQLEPDVITYTGVFASDAWINMTASWYYNGTLIKQDILYMFFHGECYNPPDPGRFQFFLDFWFDSGNASNLMGGRINAYEFPVHDSSAAWFRWLSSNWGVKDDVLKQSECMMPLYDSDGNVISSEQIQLVKVHSALSVIPYDAEQYIAVTDFSVFDTTLGDFPLKGIQTPPWDETKMPAMTNTGIFGAIWSMFAGIGKWLSDNILFGGLNLWGNFVAFLDTIAGWLGAPGFFTNLFNWIGEGFTYLVSSAGYAWDVLANIFVLMGSLLSAFVVTVGELIGSFVNTLSGFVDFMGGGIGAAGNLWDQLGIMTWLTVVIIFYPLYLLILWEQKGMDAVITQLTWIFGLLVWLYHFFEGLVTGVINLVTSLIESIPVAE